MDARFKRTLETREGIGDHGAQHRQSDDPSFGNLLMTLDSKFNVPGLSAYLSLLQL